jgi:hypothetical protein
MEEIVYFLIRRMHEVSKIIPKAGIAISETTLNIYKKV